MARILVIDDDEILAEIIAAQLQAHGHMVSTVHDGEEAVRAVRDSGPDLLILDHDLPGVSGMAILREVRQSSLNAGMPVLMLTARNGKLLPARAQNEGVDDYLIKPVAPDTLARRVEMLLAGGSMARRIARPAP